MTRTLLFMVAGVVVGGLYYKFVGCRTGACPITARAWSSMLYGGVLGFLMAR